MQRIYSIYCLHMEVGCAALGAASVTHKQLILLSQAAGSSAKGSNYLCPLTPDTAAELERRWAACRAAAGGAIVAETVPVIFGRSIELQADQVTCCCWIVAVSFCYIPP